MNYKCYVYPTQYAVQHTGTPCLIKGTLVMLYQSKVQLDIVLTYIPNNS